MKKLALFITLLFSFSIASVDVTSFESGTKNQSIPNIHFKNNDGDILGFKVYYYFSATDSKDISIDSYYTAGGVVSIKKISANQYRAEIDYGNVTVNTGTEFPNGGYLQFGLHYSDWSDWNEVDDFSYLNNQSNSLNDRIVVVSSSGDVLAGSIPSENDLNLEPCVIKVYSKSQNEENFGKYQVYAKNEGNVPVDHFDFDIEITSENGKVPIIEEWHLANVTQTIEQKNLNTWILHFSVKNINLEPNSIYPNESGLSFGVRYDDWSKFDTSNDYALADVSASYQANEKIPVYVDEKLVFGNPKIHDFIDIKKILAAENGFSLDDFDVPISSLVDPTANKQINWGDVVSMEKIVFKNVPDFERTSTAFSQILEKFPGLDAQFLVLNFKEVKKIYEQLLRLKMNSYFLDEKIISQKPSLAKKKEYVYIVWFDETLTGDEFRALRNNPMRIPGMMRATDFASAWANDYAQKRGMKDGNASDNRADGFRHAVWNALICRETGTQFDDISECINWAKRFTDAHEQNSDADAFATVMDYHNNKIGREAYAPKLRVSCEWDLGFTCVNEEVVGPSREETREMYEKLADIGIGFNDKAQLEKSPWVRRIVFFKDKDGKYYCPKGNDCIELKNPALMASKIAVLKKDLNFTCDEMLEFYLDLEDSENGSEIRSGNMDPPGIKVGGGGIRFTYCVLNMEDFGNQIPRVPYDYIVLRMDVDCPEGTFAFRRYHDSEDSNNKNGSTKNLGPSAVTKNAILEYCFVPADENSTLEYPFDAKYGVFANYSSSNVVNSKIYMDDEDSHNANSWEYYDTPADIQERIANIMEGTTNTIFYVVKWIELVWYKMTSWIGA